MPHILDQRGNGTAGAFFKPGRKTEIRTDSLYLQNMRIFFSILATTLALLPSGTAAAEPYTLPFLPEKQDTSIIEDDAIYLGELPESHIWEKKPRQKGRQWRKYYRLVHNFAKTYPYALAAKKIVEEADRNIEAEEYNKIQRQRYIKKMQDELFDLFEKPLRKLTVRQGALLMKLIDREVGHCSYDIIRFYKSKMAAGFWQGVAKIFGSDLKKPYDPDGEDRATEELVEKWEKGEFEELYYSIFWEEAPKIDIPSKYR